MIEHNYYHLMQIEPYSDISVVKKKYRELANLYHPDKNPKNKHAEEYFKVLTQGYNVLSEPGKKVEYDDLLRNYFSRTATKSKEYVSRDSVRERVRRNKEFERQQFIEEYVAEENSFPHRYRLTLHFLIFTSGLLMCYNHWFINYLDYKILYNVLGSFIFGLGCYLIADNIYRRDQFNKAMLIGNQKTHTGAVRIFVLLFIGTPIVFLMLMSLTRSIHMNYYYDFTTVNKVEMQYNEVNYYYTINGEEILRRTEAIPGNDYSQKSKLRVKFSRINPNISELVVLDHNSGNNN